MQHQDEPNELVFQDDEVDNYDYEYPDEGEGRFLEQLGEDVESLIDKCCYQFSHAEPELESEALQRVGELSRVAPSAPHPSLKEFLTPLRRLDLLLTCCHIH